VPHSATAAANDVHCAVLQVAAMKDASKSLKADYKKINLNDVEARERRDCRLYTERSSHRTAQRGAEQCDGSIGSIERPSIALQNLQDEMEDLLDYSNEISEVLGRS
jgi:hypothetical protein